MRFRGGLEPLVHVCGSDPLVGQLCAGMRSAGRSARRLTPQALGSIASVRMQTLILADPPDPALLVRHLLGLASRRRHRCRPPLRLILMHRGETPPSLPYPDPALGIQLQSVAIECGAARALLGRWPLHMGMDPAFGQLPHLLIAGFAPPAPAFLLQALRIMEYGERRPQVSLLVEDPRPMAGRLQADYPQADRVAELRFATLDDPFLSTRAPVTLALVCVPDPDRRGIDLARRVARLIGETQGISPPILLETGAIDPAGEVGDWDGQIVPISYLREISRPDVLLDGSGDEVAHSIHAHYRDTIAAQGRDPDREPAGRSWSRLADSYRQANRHQADHLWAKLAVTDCRAVAEDMVDSFAFTPLEVERLARIEHRRWAAERYLDGWGHAPVRDDARKHHPQLIPYADLSEPMKDLDRFAVRGIPTLLARSGLGILRMLIVGLPEPDPALTDAPALRSQMEATLERLVSRYPDRALILASSLRHPSARRLARLALDVADAGLFWLLPGRIEVLLDAQPDRSARAELLALAARAERRIALIDEAELGDWLARRAEITLLLGDPGSAPARAKQVVLSPAWSSPRWSFEY